MEFSSVMPVALDAFVDWLKLFAAPLQNLDMLWIIVPIWGVWVFSEFFQEKKGTSFGNAITNGAVMLFVGIDWVRYIMRQIGSGASPLGVESATEIAVSVLVILTSLLIIMLGIKGHRIVKFIGRARESTYLLLMFTPIIYGVVEFNLKVVALVFAFFPLFYILVEVVDRLMPNPQTFDLDEEGALDREFALGEKGPGLGLGGDFGGNAFGADVGKTGFSQPPRQQMPRQLRKGGL